MPNIDFLYDTADNTLETIVDSGFVINQGVANDLVFRFFFKDYDNNVPFTIADLLGSQCLINIQRPDNSASNNIVASADTTNICYKLNVSDWAVSLSGTLKITAKLYNPLTDVTTTFGLATLQILPSATVGLDTIEDAQYQAILDALLDINSATYIVRASEDIPAGALVTYAGTLGASGKIIVALARASGQYNININPELIFGVTKDAMLQNEEGRVVTNGLIKDIDTEDYTEGAILYPNISVAGGLTNTPAVPPNNRMPIAVSIYSHQNKGILIVRPTFWPTMSQIKDVDTSGIEVGQVLKWNGSKFVAGPASGLFYDDNLPPEEELQEYMTWFDEEQ